MAGDTLVHRPRPAASVSASSDAPMWLWWTWALFLCAALLSLEQWSLPTWGLVVPIAAAALLALTGPLVRTVDWFRSSPDLRDLGVGAGLYLAVVGLLRLAFVGFGTDELLGLFLSYAGGLLLGVAGPVVYTVWFRRRPLASLGLGLHNLRATLALGGVLAGVQFAMTLGRVSLPAPVDWVPLLVMSVMVGLFEAIFFRGFIQTRLEASFGTAPAIAGAAGLYGLYHVGYGMGTDELVFLGGLGVVYAIAFRLVGSLFVLWPLLTPLGAFFNNLQAGDIDLPWASIAGFANVLALMAVAVWLAGRHQRRRPTIAAASGGG